MSMPVGVAPGPVLEPDRVALGVHAEALLARQRALHRAVEQPRGERGVGLVAHVLLAAERAAVGHQLDRHPVGRRRRARGRCRRGRPTRPGRRSRRAASRSSPSPRRHGERRLGLEEGVLDALGLEHLVHGVGARGEAAVDVAAGVGAARQHVVVGAPHGELGARLDGGQRVGDRRQHVVARPRRAPPRHGPAGGSRRRRSPARRRRTTCARRPGSSSASPCG